MLKYFRAFHAAFSGLPFVNHTGCDRACGVGGHNLAASVERVCTRARVCVCVCVLVRMRRTYVHIYVGMYVRIMHEYMYIYVCIVYIYIYIYTHRAFHNVIRDYKHL